jgi:hypothetical protein
MLLWDAVIAENGKGVGRGGGGGGGGGIGGASGWGGKGEVDGSNPGGGVRDFIEAFAVAMLLFVRWGCTS